MFRAFETIKDERAGNNLYTHQYVIIDSNFTEASEVLTSRSGLEIERAVCMVYERRNLPVAPNLARCIVYLFGGEAKKYHESIQSIVDWNRVWNDRYTPYANAVDQELARYLTLL
jgi:hypothetical protein